MTRPGCARTRVWIVDPLEAPASTARAARLGVHVALWDRACDDLVVGAVAVARARRGARSDGAALLNDSAPAPGRAPRRGQPHAARRGARGGRGFGWGVVRWLAGAKVGRWCSAS